MPLKTEGSSSFEYCCFGKYTITQPQYNNNNNFKTSHITKQNMNNFRHDVCGVCASIIIVHKKIFMKKNVENYSTHKNNNL